MLLINLDKSCFMHFPCNETNVRKDTSSYVNDNNTRALLIGDERIPEVDSIKFLGVTFDRGLTWGKHTENLYKRSKCALAVIKRIKHRVTEQNFKTLYSSLFESHLQLLYGISVWGGISHTKLDKLFRLQKKCVRILFGDLKQYMDKFSTYARTIWRSISNIRLLYV